MVVGYEWMEESVQTFYQDRMGDSCVNQRGDLCVKVRLYSKPSTSPRGVMLLRLTIGCPFTFSAWQ